MSSLRPLYFAYGSNMSPRQMARRCPGSRAIGRAVLADWSFIINTRGAANIVPADGLVVHGVLWRIDPGHLGVLDEWEGTAHRIYIRRTLVVHLDCGRQRLAFTYVSPQRREGRPKPGYLATAVLRGAKAFALPAHVLDELAGWQPERPIGESRRAYLGQRTRKRSRTA
ncbi:MAG: gamma-glutamylcyclotransferase family protein [Hyphomicrobiaceae bacterium]|nr:gamma-glutamylcyclotransferase family protein [Hyphomicrobiaceae bacterium]